jgi:hypothetical protein
MKVFITHDEYGKITAIGMPGSQFAEGVGAKATKTGERVAVVNVADIQHIQHVHFEKILDEYLVDVKSAEPKLMRKPDRP